jgi:hypothetical protein
MVEVRTIIPIGVKPDSTLGELWKSFADDMRECGAGADQIDAMEVTFYMGAAQVYASIDHAARKNNTALRDIMKQLYHEIDAKMQRIDGSGSGADFDTAGNA